MLMVPKNSEISRSAWRSSRVSGWGLGCGGSGAWTGVLVGELVDALKFLLDSFRQHKGIGSVSSAEIRVRQDLVEGERKRDGVSRSRNVRVPLCFVSGSRSRATIDAFPAFHCTATTLAQHP